MVTRLLASRPEFHHGVEELAYGGTDPFKKGEYVSNALVTSMSVWFSGSLPWGWTIANLLVFKRVKEALGFSQCRNIVVGAAPIHRETLEFFMGFDIPILELYGMSESTGPHTSNMREFGRWRTGSCGKNISGVETKIDNPDEQGDGEVSVMSHVFSYD